MRISDWSSDVCSSDFVDHQRRRAGDLAAHRELLGAGGLGVDREAGHGAGELLRVDAELDVEGGDVLDRVEAERALERARDVDRLVHRVVGTVDKAHRLGGEERARRDVAGDDEQWRKGGEEERTEENTYEINALMRHA